MANKLQRAASNLDQPANSNGKWMALVAALLGWMFDGFEIGMFPLVGHNALKDLLGTGTVANAGLERPKSASGKRYRAHGAPRLSAAC